MKKIVRSAGLWVLLVAVLPVQAHATRLLVPVGKVVGLQLQNDTLTVAAYDDLWGDAARSAGLKIAEKLPRLICRLSQTGSRKKLMVEEVRAMSMITRNAAMAGR